MQGKAQSDFKAEYWTDFVVQNFLITSMSTCLVIRLQDAQILPNPLIAIVVDYLKLWENIFEVLLLKEQHGVLSCILL